MRRIIGGLIKPAALTHANDASGRLFIVEQAGRILVFKDGALLPEPFLDIRDRVNDQGNEQGLLGLAFDPEYALNGRFFINYTRADGGTIIARYTVSADPDRADPDSARSLMQYAQPYANHNGGALAFGPDGYLYIAAGDGGSGGDPRGNGQRLDTLLGKILRVDVSRESYAAPPDNPFTGQAGAFPEIWAYGLRNPWRLTFDRLTGDLYIADVGQNAYEEVNFQPAASPGGENYGWNFMEGLHPYKGQAPPGLTAPVLEYSHAQGGCSVTGGYVYRGPSLPGLQGVYLYGDYCSGRVWAALPGDWQPVELMDTDLTLSSFGEDQAGELYLLDHGGGAVYRLEAAVNG